MHRPTRIWGHVSLAFAGPVQTESVSSLSGFCEVGTDEHFPTMECIVFVGIQGSGKSAFFKERFADTHLRINLDMLKTRHREAAFFQLCLETGMRCVIDNTNPTAKER